MKERTGKQLRKIKAELGDLAYFKNTPFNQTNPEFNEIFKRDNSTIIELIAPFLQVGYYQQGRVVEATALERTHIRFLLNGEVSQHEPVSQKSFKNCQNKVKEH